MLSFDLVSFWDEAKFHIEEGLLATLFCIKFSSGREFSFILLKLLSRESIILMKTSALNEAFWVKSFIIFGEYNLIA